jgi:phage tail P2-like protein
MTDAVTLLPPNSTAVERALASTNAAIDAIPVPFRELWNPDTCPVAFLPSLAYAFGVSQWDSAWSEAQKRSAIKSSMYVQRHKGTIGSVQTALSSLGFDLVVQEWFNQVPLGDPGTFDVLLNSNLITGVDEESLSIILRLVDTYKNLRSHMRTVRPSLTVQTELCTASVLCVGVTLTIPPDIAQTFGEGVILTETDFDVLVTEDGESLAQDRSDV